MQRAPSPDALQASPGKTATSRKALSSIRRPSSPKPTSPVKNLDVRPRKASCELPEDAFDCPICTEPMISRIFQCPGGHHVCEDCLARLEADARPCPSCQRPFPAEGFRCRAMEKLAEQLEFQCPWGCGFSARPSLLQPHVSACELRPLPCIIKGCRHHCCARSMPEHLMEHTDHVAVGEYQRYNCHSRTEFWQDGSFSNLHLVQTSAGYMCFSDQRVDGNWFRAKAYHFGEESLCYTVTVRGERGQALSLSGPTSSIAEGIDQDHIAMHKDQLDRFLFPPDDGGWTLEMHVTAEAIRDVVNG